MLTGIAVWVALALSPLDARVIVLKADLPGFMDAHTHLRGDPAPKTLHAGFTTVRDLGSVDFLDVSLRNAIRDGHIEGPRMLVAVRGLGTTGGHCDPTNSFRFGLLDPRMESPTVVNGPDAMRAAARSRARALERRAPGARFAPVSIPSNRLVPG